MHQKKNIHHALDDKEEYIRLYAIRNKNATKKNYEKAAMLESDKIRTFSKNKLSELNKN